MLIWANELDAITRSISIVRNPNINLDLRVICSPFKVVTTKSGITNELKLLPAGHVIQIGL